MVSGYGNSTFAASLNTKTIEKLVKATEVQATGISKHIDIYEPEEIKVIDAKTIEGLSSSIKKAKDGLKNYKGKLRTSFVKRIESSESTLQKGKIFNNTIAKGALLLKDLRHFQTQFIDKPFASEKILNDLIKKNDQYTKDKKKLINASAIDAFSMKYQVSVENEISQCKTFYETNNRIENFISFTETNENGTVWNEILSIDYDIQKSISNKAYSKLLAEKWKAMYYPTFVEPEKATIEKLFVDYEAAFNARDAISVAEFFYFENAEEKQTYIESLTDSFSTLPNTDTKGPFKLDLRFVYNGTAILFFTETASIEADDENSQPTPLIILVKKNDKWLFMDSGE